LVGLVDPEGDPQTYTVTALPAVGTLFLNGAALTLGQSLTDAQFAALTYTSPATSGSGTVTFDVSDGVHTVGHTVNLNTTAAESKEYDGTAGADRLDGAGGNDFIDGKAGGDTMIGGTGNDTFIVDNAGDTVDEVGGNGIDLVRSSVSFNLAGAHALGSIEKLVLTGSATSGVGNLLANAITGNTVSNVLNGAGGNDTLRGLAGNDTLIGGAGHDSLDGGAGRDTLYGNAGNDELLGSANSDRLIGGAGNDVLNGGTGRDTLSGGAGNDVFVFDTAPGANFDLVTDFRNVAGDNDRIRLAKAVFTELGSTGPLSADKFYAGASAHDADDRVVYHQATGELFYDANGNAAGGVVHIATLTNHALLTASDFSVF
jgi:Ca2+-binding RTX toxin-like protein